VGPRRIAKSGTKWLPKRFIMLDDKRHWLEDTIANRRAEWRFLALFGAFQSALIA
jgi:hypothetical protein